MNTGQSRPTGGGLPSFVADPITVNRGRPGSIGVAPSQTSPPLQAIQTLQAPTNAERCRIPARRGEETVPALVLARQPTAAHGRGLPLPRLIATSRSSSIRYSLTKIDDRGRVADRSSIRALLWEPGHRIHLTIAPGAVVLVSSSTDGRHAINNQGHLRLPAPVRRSCGLQAGDQLLLAADRDRDIVVVYTMFALDAIILGWRHLSTTEARL